MYWPSISPSREVRPVELELDILALSLKARLFFHLSADDVQKAMLQVKLIDFINDSSIRIENIDYLDSLEYFVVEEIVRRSRSCRVLARSSVIEMLSHNLWDMMEHVTLVPDEML